MTQGKVYASRQGEESPMAAQPQLTISDEVDQVTVILTDEWRIVKYMETAHQTRINIRRET